MTKQEMNKPAWLKLTEADLKKIIKDLAEKNDPSVIGIILRDQYGVPTTKVYGKKLGEYLKEMGIEVNEEVKNAKIKMENLEAHTKKNITDKKAKHKLQKAQSNCSVLKKHLA
jgi:small subunit ribosomal protein S15